MNKKFVEDEQNLRALIMAGIFSGFCKTTRRVLSPDEIKASVELARVTCDNILPNFEILGCSSEDEYSDTIMSLYEFMKEAGRSLAKYGVDGDAEFGRDFQTTLYNKFIMPTQERFVEKQKCRHSKVWIWKSRI